MASQKDQVIEREVIERDLKFYGMASYLATYSDYSVRVGCLAAHNTKRLAGTFNTHRNPASNVPYGGATYHAEHNCLAMVPDRLLTRVTLYIARLHKDGSNLPSRPCLKCAMEIALSGVREIVYLSSERRIVKEIFR